MKKLMVSLALLMALLLVCTAAHAMTQQEWNECCKRKTARKATIYSITYVQVATPGDVGGDTAAPRFDPIGTLEAGTYVSPISPKTDDKYEVMYWSASGTQYIFATKPFLLRTADYIKKEPAFEMKQVPFH